MAPRVLHLFTKLRFKSGQVPCSNLVFVRSRRERDIHRELTSLKDLCWTFHEFAIERLHPQVILCFGKTVGRYVRNQVGANTLRKEFVETNERKWRSQWFDSSRGPRVVVATHPSVADWRAPNTDPTQLILEALR